MMTLMRVLTMQLARAKRDGRTASVSLEKLSSGASKLVAVTDSAGTQATLIGLSRPNQVGREGGRLQAAAAAVSATTDGRVAAAAGPVRRAPTPSSLSGGVRWLSAALRGRARSLAHIDALGRRESPTAGYYNQDHVDISECNGMAADDSFWHSAGDDRAPHTDEQRWPGARPGRSVGRSVGRERPASGL
jgi:hypothetical protein